MVNGVTRDRESARCPVPESASTIAFDGVLMHIVPLPREPVSALASAILRSSFAIVRVVPWATDVGALQQPEVRDAGHQQKRPAISASRTPTNPMTYRISQNSEGGTRTRDPGIMSSLVQGGPRLRTGAQRHGAATYGKQPKGTCYRDDYILRRWTPNRLDVSSASHFTIASSPSIIQ